MATHIEIIHNLVMATDIEIIHDLAMTTATKLFFPHFCQALLIHCLLSSNTEASLNAVHCTLIKLDIQKRTTVYSFIRLISLALKTYLEKHCHDCYRYKGHVID